MHLFLYIGCLLFLQEGFDCSAQDVQRFKQKNCYNSSSTALINKLKYQIDSETADQKTSNEIVQKANDQRFKYLRQLIFNKAFIQDEKFESCVAKITDRLVKANNLTDRPRTILILKSVDVNAFNYGKGIFIITVGFLARIENEPTLAMVLAHEMAHDELQHIQKRIFKEAELEQHKQTKKLLHEMATGHADSTTLESLKNIVYNDGHFNRREEFEADSVGIHLFANAGYDPHEATKIFQILAAPTASKSNLGIEILLPLHSDEYPIQDHWVTDRSSTHYKGQTSIFGLSIDSLRSHPDTGMRIAKLKTYSVKPVLTSFVDLPELNEVIKEAELELLELCYTNKMYDRGIFYALQLLHDDKNNALLVSKVAEMLLNLKNARDLSTFNAYVGKITAGYSDELKLVNNLLQNLSTKELAELGYHFLLDERHFNDGDPSHYYIKWKLCEATYRYNESKETRSTFKAKFGTSIERHKLH